MFLKYLLQTPGNLVEFCFYDSLDTDNSCRPYVCVGTVLTQCREVAGVVAEVAVVVELAGPTVNRVSLAFTM